MVAQKVLDAVDANEAVCPMPVRYVQLPTSFVQLFKQYFTLPATDAARWLPSVSHLQYHDEQADGTPPLPVDKFTSAVEIGRLEEYPGDRHTDLPKILVRRGGVTKSQLGIGDNVHMLPGINSGAAKLYSHTYTLSVITFAMSRDIGQADHLGAECEQLLSHFTPAIRKTLELLKLNVSQVGEVGKLKEFPNFFVVPIVADIQYTEAVQLKDGGMPLRHVNLKITFE